MSQEINEELEILKEKIQNQYTKAQEKAKGQWKKKEKELLSAYNSLLQSSIQFQEAQQQLMKANQNNKLLLEELNRLRAEDNSKGAIERLKRIEEQKKELDQLREEIALVSAQNDLALANKNKYKKLFLSSNRELHHLKEISKRSQGLNNSSLYTDI